MKNYNYNIFIIKCLYPIIIYSVFGFYYLFFILFFKNKNKENITYLSKDLALSNNNFFIVNLRFLYVLFIILFNSKIIKYIKKYLFLSSNKFINNIIFLILLIPIFINIIKGFHFKGLSLFINLNKNELKEVYWNLNKEKRINEKLFEKSYKLQIYEDIKHYFIPISEYNEKIESNEEKKLEELKLLNKKQDEYNVLSDDIDESSNELKNLYILKNEINDKLKQSEQQIKINNEEIENIKRQMQENINNFYLLQLDIKKIEKIITQISKDKEKLLINLEQKKVMIEEINKEIEEKKCKTILLSEDISNIKNYIKEYEDDIKYLKLNKNNKSINKLSLLRYFFTLYYYSFYYICFVCIVREILGIGKRNKICDSNINIYINKKLIILLENQFFSLNELQNIFNNSYNKVKQDNNLKGIKSYIPYTLLSLIYTDNYTDSFKIILLFFIYIIQFIMLIISLILSFLIIKEIKIFSPFIFIEKYFKLISNNNNKLYYLYNCLFYIFCYIIISPFMTINLMLMKIFSLF